MRLSLYVRLVFSLASLAGYARKSRAWQQPEFLLIPFIYPFVTNAVKTFHISIFPSSAGVLRRRLAGQGISIPPGPGPPSIQMPAIRAKARKLLKIPKALEP